jgi:hypothetical protein
MPLKRLIHQLWSAAFPDRCLDHGQRQCRDANTFSFDDVGRG